MLLVHAGAAGLHGRPVPGQPFVVPIGPFGQWNASPGGESLPAGVFMWYGVYALPPWSAMLMLRVSE